MIDVDKTAAWIAGVQQDDGAIPWFPGGKLDPWDHVEAAMGLDVAGRHADAAAAYRWLAHNQNDDGSWYAEYRDGRPHDPHRDANFTAYIAVGAHHHYVSTQDSEFLRLLWPAIDRALGFALSLQRDDGAIRWRRDPDGGVASEVLLTSCCSIHHALVCGTRIAYALGHDRPRWAAAAQRIRDAVTGTPEIFLPKPLAMDWYYPVLTGVLETSVAADRIHTSWDRFVQPGRGVRCVHHEPWTTGGETAELALTLAATGRADTARKLLDDIGHLAADDGSYWTGHNYATNTHWPLERTTWTAGAILLANAAITGHTPTLTTFTASTNHQAPRPA